MPFEGKLDPNNRWIRLSELMPWEKIEEIYLQTMSMESDREAITARMAFEAIFIKESERYIDERIVIALQENPYMQYFLGLREFQTEPLFDPAMMVHFRKRFPVEDVAKINKYVYTGKLSEEQRNVDRNEDADDGDEPPIPPCGEANPSEQKEERTPIRLKRKKNVGKRTAGNCFWMPR